MATKKKAVKKKDRITAIVKRTPLNGRNSVWDADIVLLERPEQWIYVVSEPASLHSHPHCVMVHSLIEARCRTREQAEKLAEALRYTLRTHRSSISTKVMGALCKA